MSNKLAFISTLDAKYECSGRNCNDGFGYFVCTQGLRMAKSGTALEVLPTNIGTWCRTKHKYVTVAFCQCPHFSLTFVSSLAFDYTSVLRTTYGDATYSRLDVWDRQTNGSKGPVFELKCLQCVQLIEKVKISDRQTNMSKGSKLYRS